VAVTAIFGSPAPMRSGDESGVVLLHVVFLLTMVMAVAGAAALLARVEIMVSRYHREGREAAYAAQAMLAAAMRDLDGILQWSDVLAGTRVAGFADGAGNVPRQIPGGGTILVCCGPGTATGRVQTESGLGWRPFAWQSLAGLLELPNAARFYLVAWVVDDPDDADGDSSADSNGRIMVRAEAMTALGARKAVEGLLERGAPDPLTGLVAPGLRLLTWREVH
jgi:hypothetical protein